MDVLDLRDLTCPLPALLTPQRRSRVVHHVGLGIGLVAGVRDNIDVVPDRVITPARTEVPIALYWDRRGHSVVALVRFGIAPVEQEIAVAHRYRHACCSVQQ